MQVRSLNGVGTDDSGIALGVGTDDSGWLLGGAGFWWMVKSYRSAKVIGIKKIDKKNTIGIISRWH